MTLRALAGVSYLSVVAAQFRFFGFREQWWSVLFMSVLGLSLIFEPWLRRASLSWWRPRPLNGTVWNVLLHVGLLVVLVAMNVVLWSLAP